MWLDRNQIGDIGARGLAEGLRVNRSLWNLRLNNNRIGDEGASALREALRENNTLH